MTAAEELRAALDELESEAVAQDLYIAKAEAHIQMMWHSLERATRLALSDADGASLKSTNGFAQALHVRAAGNATVVGFATCREGRGPLPRSTR